MKSFKILILLLPIIFSSCSSDSDTQEEITPYFFNVTTNSTPLAVENWKAEKDGDYFKISASKFHSVEANGNVLTNEFFALFHKDGTLLNINMNDNSRRSYLYPSYNLKSRLSFTIESIDEVNKTLKVNFSGQMFKYDVNNVGNIIFEDVSGLIFLPFENMNPNIPSIANYGTTCQLNSQNWRGLGRADSSTTDQFIIQIFGYDEHSIELVLPTDNLQTGTHTYSGGAAAFHDYSINYLKYNNQNSIGDEGFVTSGTITVTEIGLGFVKGTFSFTSNNPNTGENIVVTGGVFSEKVY